MRKVIEKITGKLDRYMAYNIIRKPFMLLETVSMLYRYINNIKAEDTNKRPNAVVDEELRKARTQRAQQIQQVTMQVCGDVDRSDPEMQKFFGATECGCENTCLAMILTYSFHTLDCPDFWDHVEEVCRLWKLYQEEGYWIQSASTVALSFTRTMDSPGDLIRQIKALNYSADFRVELMDALTHFPETVHQLAERIVPLAERLEGVYREKPQLLGERWDYWENVTRDLSPAEFLSTMGMNDEAEDAAEDTWLAAGFMNTNIMAAMGAKNSLRNLEHNLVLVGSLISVESIAIRRGVELDGITVLMKCLADRKRLEILHRLAKERSYGLALSESIGMDPGQVSRSLGMMHNFGFLKLERESLRAYYVADREAFHEFLMRLEEVIFS